MSRYDQDTDGGSNDSPASEYEAWESQSMDETRPSESSSRRRLPWRSPSSNARSLDKRVSSGGGSKDRNTSPDVDDDYTSRDNDGLEDEDENASVPIDVQIEDGPWSSLLAMDPAAQERPGTAVSRLSPKVQLVRDRLSSLGLNADQPIFRTKSTKRRFVHKQQPMLVLEFRDNGSTDFVEMRRDDIMQEARRMVPEPRILPMRTQEERDIAAAAYEDPSIVRRRYKGTLQHRDIRVLDPSFAQSRDPGILVRRHSILVNLQPIRALLFYNKTLVFIPDGADSILSTLMQRLRDAGEEHNNVPFSMRSLECIFVTVCQLLHEQVTKLAPEVHETVEEIIRTSSGVTIERLRQAKSRVSKISSRLVGVQDAFDELLENDRDMALMNLDKVHNFPTYYSDDREDVWCVDHEDIELLIENYAQAIDGTYSQVEALRAEIDSAISSISLRLDSARNKLLGIDLLVTSVTAAAALGALIAALFGMNLDSGVTEAGGWFWGWFGAVVGAMPVIVALMFFGIYRAGLLIT
mmetsp:Transcript_22434/g.44041  ORF Transcript_22434/g.44041 Transcript_22434/m.44041 type:complete len:523 (-) Transcript_22434:663-2231(-)|eukprot:CAMPEP_0171491724 /NCGR_PEP_ID=MMETSP0958-20121227/4012_1 /TAXON_ID=87120 /ORGANISM="Aurantiochytrium limacinum, Strain ATCCMYA-1381" /LENGTH=522 /DNA_ID=CAMNT_0012025161 /DNA_START=494 /DNA_END=2062 /DNA_ORIENTATION=+